MSEKSDALLDESEAEFQRAWDAADWMFKNDRQDAKYFFLLGQRVEKVKQLQKADEELKQLQAIVEGQHGKTENESVSRM